MYMTHNKTQSWWSQETYMHVLYTFTNQGPNEGFHKLCPEMIEIFSYHADADYIASLIDLMSTTIETAATGHRVVNQSITNSKDTEHNCRLLITFLGVCTEQTIRVLCWTNQYPDSHWGVISICQSQLANDVANVNITMPQLSHFFNHPLFCFFFPFICFSNQFFAWYVSK